MKEEKMSELAEALEMPVTITSDGRTVITTYVETVYDAAREWLRVRSIPDDEPRLGLATTRQLLDELRARIEVDGRLDYRTVDE